MTMRGASIFTLGFALVIALGGCGAGEALPLNSPVPSMALPTPSARVLTPALVATITSLAPVTADAPVVTATPLPTRLPAVERDGPVEVGTPPGPGAQETVLGWLSKNTDYPIRNISIDWSLSAADAQGTHVRVELELRSRASGDWLALHGTVTLINEAGRWTISEANPPDLRVVPNPQYTGMPSRPLWEETNLLDVYMLSPDEGWAVGSAQRTESSEDKAMAEKDRFDTFGPDDYGLLLHYSEGEWQNVTGPDLIDFHEFSHIRMLSSTEGWLIGGLRKYQVPNRLLRLTDGRWTPDATFPQNRENSTFDAGGLSIFSLTEGWVYGQMLRGTKQDGGIVYQFKEGTWLRSLNTGVPGDYISGATGRIEAFYMLPSGEGLLAEDGSLHQYKAGQWTQMPLPPGITHMGDLHLLSPNEGWAIASNDAGDSRNVLLHLVDSEWKIDSTWDAKLSEIQMVSADEGWAVGRSGAVTQAGQSSGVVLRYADSKWSQVEVVEMGGLYGLHMLSAKEGWAVGEKGTLVHYKNGAWTRIEKSSLEE